MIRLPDSTPALSKRRLNERESLAYGGSTYNIDRAYDANASLLQLKYPDNATVGYNPNALGEPRQLGTYATSITYHPNGAVASFTYGNGIAHSLTQNLRGLPQQSTDGSLLNDQYSYDENANVAGIADLAQAPTMSVSRTPSPMTAGQSYTLSWSSTNATSVSRTCTASGTGYTVNDAPGLSGTSTGTASSAWVGFPSSCSWRATGAGGTATFNETMTTNAAPPTEVVTYTLTDGLGSPVARTDSAGNLVSRTRYEPYGLTASGATPSIGFTGHVNDADTGLVYMQQRYYDPVAGRMLSIDPVTTDANTGGSFNRYAYAQNNPYRYIDPDGRYSDESSNQSCRDMVGNCSSYGSLTGNASNSESANKTSAQHVFTTMGSVLESGLSTYVLVFTIAVPEVAAAERIAAATAVGTGLIETGNDLSCRVWFGSKFNASITGRQRIVSHKFPYKRITWEKTRLSIHQSSSNFAPCATTLRLDTYLLHHVTRVECRSGSIAAISSYMSSRRSY